MSLAPRTRQTLTTRLALSPGMRRSLALLRLPLPDLHEDLAHEAETNPFLAFRPGRLPGAALDAALATTAAGESIAQSLAHQIRMQGLDRTTEAVALFLVEELREDGYLDVELDEIAERFGLEHAVLDRAVAALQACEPTGIGARSAEEFMALSLRETGISPDLAQRLCQRLTELAEGRWSALRRDTGLPVRELERIADFLRSLPSAPLQAEGDPALPMIPEIAIQRSPDGLLSVRPVAEAWPAVRVRRLPDEAQSNADLVALHRRAVEIASALSARSATLIRIGELIAHEQAEFFIGGFERIKPMTRRDVASALSLHPSTVGRAIAGKALEFEGRVFALATFFSRSVPGNDTGNGPAPSAFDVQRRIRQLIAAESPDAPLADETIRAQLKNEGVDMARRTVAKYRKCMRIPSSHGRRRPKGTPNGAVADCRHLKNQKNP
ncbi:RNA polymerase RpoN-/SigL-like sigma 54 subunit [Albidovulum inexpectatum]|uniref:RNA polymerase sigma-54 factor n=1 Tax=Albidovulum inexpectatum TaxID=196587 RepID=A0A2S5JM60_9RHOB|nr:hypothetical protein [Albidovulum inexpectatum]PPB82512.1 RNA polymerase RpoN-/SigL-like sigma 54 subunit [Albidovulum inexpectatum]